MAQLWGRCPRRHPWFAISDRSLAANYLCPTCLEPAESLRMTRLRLPAVRSKERRTG